MTFDQALKSLGAYEFADDEVAAVLRRTGKPTRRRSRTLALTLAATTLALLLAAAVPAGRAGMEDVMARFFAGGDPPGPPMSHDNAPEWLRAATSTPHVLAQSGAERLLAYHSPSGSVCFEFSVGTTSSGECFPAQGQTGGGADALFHGQPVALWGPNHQDEAGRWLLWGIATDNVARVALRYSNGSATSALLTNGGFIMRTQPSPTPETLVAFDSHGNKLASVDIQQRFALAPVAG
jgi:hypothetical protein